VPQFFSLPASRFQKKKKKKNDEKSKIKSEVFYFFVYFGRGHDVEEMAFYQKKRCDTRKKEWCQKKL
jgi:hypothetical protein